jgi:hypothetical protein
MPRAGVSAPEAGVRDGVDLRVVGCWEVWEEGGGLKSETVGIWGMDVKVSALGFVYGGRHTSIMET